MEGQRRRDPCRAHLPVLIVPGFMSTGLTIETTDAVPSWQGKRIWLNIASLGLESFFRDKGPGDEGMKRGPKWASGKTLQGRRKSLFMTGTSDDELDDSSDEDSEGEVSKEDDDDNEETQGLIDNAVESGCAATRNQWIRHISLSPRDLKSDPPGMKVRPLSGLEGVDYLTSDALTRFGTFVWAPVIKVLKRHGYEEGTNLEAASYDWRLSPKHLEERDGYFTNTMKKIEEMHDRTGLPVVLVCHSLGCRVAQHLLAFAHARDDAWCDKHVHAYMPVGAPHLGAPFTLRSLVTGDDMGVPFLKESESLAMARTLGSVPWLIPTEMPPHVPENAFVRREGAFEVRVDCTVDVSSLLARRVDGAKPEKLKLELKYGRRTLRSKFFPIIEEKVRFDRTFIFSTGPEGPYERRRCARCGPCCVLSCVCCACCSNNRLIVSICEPGYRAARRSKEGEEMRRRLCSFSTERKWLKILTCWWLFKWVLILIGYVLYLVYFKLWLSVADVISKCCGGSTWMAVAEPIEICKKIVEAESHIFEVELHHELRQSKCCRKGGLADVPTIKMSVRWVPPDALEHLSTGSQLSELNINRYRLINGLTCKQHGHNWDYEAVTGSRLLKQELGRDAPALKAVSDYYDADPLQPRGSWGAPPVKNVRAVYGINLRTEVGAVYRRRRALVQRRDKVKSRYALDIRAKFKTKNGYVLDDGLLFETKDTPQMIEAKGRSVACSGDGTVPYWSLQHVQSWKSHCNVEVTELEGSEHRAILADSRFHEVLVDYITSKPDECERVV